MCLFIIDDLLQGSLSEVFRAVIKGLMKTSGVLELSQFVSINYSPIKMRFLCSNRRKKCLTSGGKKDTSIRRCSFEGEDYHLEMVT